MAFNIALSGLNAAQTDLDVKGNNISNASTTGFKRSRAEFGDLYSSGLQNLGDTSAGDGVSVQNTRQLFQQGNVTATSNGLDMAIDGEGFFVTESPNGERQFTRSGQFGVNEEGFVTNNQGARVQGFQADDDGEVGDVRGDLEVNTENLAPKSTTNVAANLNLDSRETVPEEEDFDSSEPNSYNHSTTSTIYDSLGNPHEMSQYFVKQGSGDNEWKSHVEIDGEPVGDTDGFDLTFQENGSLDIDNSDDILIDNWEPKDEKGDPNGAQSFDDGAEPTADNSNFVIDYSDTTQVGSEFAVNDLQQNGFATGRLTGLDVSEEGVIQARFSNGESEALGQVALANFRNSEGLASVGDTSWVETIDSGDAVISRPNTGPLGAIQSSSLEESNVDLSEQLVGLITAQRNFQANSKTIETSDQITQTIINLR
ncbi:MAG: flagellar hook protein FlgE [Pseudomonadota bacterium]